MLIKEYHIPLPLTLDEYSIAQLYMIQKKSREESEGHDSAVEILENRPYTDGPQGKGQYTYKIFHIGRHLPSWFRSIAPKSALEVHEESWNAYPYTKTKFSVPYVEKFSIEIETKFVQDNGHQDNIFQLKSSELRQREVDVIDIVQDQLSGNDYKTEEDPRHYVSKKTGRGPLADDWVTNPPNGIIMCAYKLIKVEFRYWGLQSKVERLIHDHGLRRVMLRAHRQAWAWQDEWEGLTMDDVRRLERETQLILQRKLGRVTEESGQLEDNGEEREREEIHSEIKQEESDHSSSHNTSPNHTLNKHRHSYPNPSSPSPSHPPPLNKSTSEMAQGSSLHPASLSQSGRRMKKDRSMGILPQHRLPMSRTQSRVEGESDMESMYSARPEWALDSIAISDTESDLEYFDALETASGLDDSDGEYEEIEAKGEEGGGVATNTMFPSSSLQSLSSEEDFGVGMGTSTEPPHTVDILFLVIQGGAAVHGDSSVGRSLDYQTICSNITDVAQLHFHSAIGRWAIRQVPCPNLTTSAYRTLCEVNPIPVSLDSLVVDPSLRPHPLTSPSYSSFPTHLPVAVMPLLTTQAPGYSDKLRAVSVSANRVYQEFLQSPEGKGFNGQVCLITDCMGSVVTYDILTSNSHCLTPSPSSPLSSRSLGVPQQQQQQQFSSLSSNEYSSSVTPSHQLNRYHSEDLTPQPLSTTFRLKHSSSLSPLPNLKSHTLPLTTPIPTITTSVGFDFDVTHFFCLGSPLGLVLASRQMTQCRQGTPAPPPPRPNCTAFYNLCYGNDPISSRIEPLLDPRFAHLTPATIPVYRLHPKGLAEPSTLQGAVIKHPYLFGSQLGSVIKNLTRKKSVSAECVHITVEGEGETPTSSNQSEDMKPFSVWWSRHRLDYLLKSSLTTIGYDSLPLTAITHIIHSSYWEAKEVVSFILRQVLLHDSTCIVSGREDGREETPFIPHQSIEKWSRKRTTMKIKRLSSNHRVNDVLSLCSGPSPILHAKFQYGPLGMVSLAKEMVDVFVLSQRGKNNSWKHIDTVATDKHGRISYTLTHSLESGVHPIKLLAKGDHTTAGCNVFMVPPYTEAVVFSVDGALADNFSISGRDMKCKSGAVEVASHWRDLGYLLIYLTGRPDIQKDYIMKFLAANAFPLGVVACGDSISTDPQTKTIYLARLIKEAKVIIQAAYGSQRHLGIYTELGLLSDQIFILSRKTSKKEHVNCQVLGSYQDHVQELVKQSQRPALTSIVSLIGKDTCFALPGNQKHERRRRRKSRTGSMSKRKLSPKLSHRRETTV